VAAGLLVIAAGTLLLIATPVMRVAISIAAFGKERDRTFMAMATTVPLLLLLSSALGYAG
jgi:uncharacterized membrane protein